MAETQCLPAVEVLLPPAWGTAPHFMAEWSYSYSHQQEDVLQNLHSMGSSHTYGSSGQVNSRLGSG